MKSPRHTLLKITDSLNKKVPYECICAQGGDIYLGRVFVRYIDTAIFSLALISLLLGAKIPLPVILLLSTIFSAVYIPIYFSIYKEMNASKHSERCSKKAAIYALPYQTRGSWFEIKK